METLLPVPSPRPLTLPVAALARLSGRPPVWLRHCLESVQAEYLDADSAVDCACAERRERQAHEANACRELLVDAWMDALCPSSYFGGVIH